MWNKTKTKKIFFLFTYLYMDDDPFKIIDTYVIGSSDQQALRLTAITQVLYFDENENVHREHPKITRKHPKKWGYKSTI